MTLPILRINSIKLSSYQVSYDLSYKPKSKTTTVSSQYLLNKLEKSKKIPKESFQYFDNNIRDKKN